MAALLICPQGRADDEAADVPTKTLPVQSATAPQKLSSISSSAAEPRKLSPNGSTPVAEPARPDAKPPAAKPTSQPARTNENPLSAANASSARVYRPIALIAEEAPILTPLTPNDWVLDRVSFPDGRSSERVRTDLPEGPNAPDPILSNIEPGVFAPGQVAGEPGMVVDEGPQSSSFEAYTDLTAHGLGWGSPMEWTALPMTRLWEIPLANQREPRTYAKFHNVHGQSAIDTAIGGQFGIVRWGPVDRPYEGWQLDGFGAVFTRFDTRRRLQTADYRAGAPITYAKGPWQAKFGYEHTSTHLGDEYIAATGRRQVAHVRDELVWGLARRFWDDFRIYGQIGYSFYTSNVIGNNRDRYDWGLEWSRRQKTSKCGQPFAAFDMDLRSDQNYTVNTTLQLGWQWRNALNWSGRICLEYYNGRSPYGQFFLDREHWVGISFLYDW
jgi:hypothetical protein